MYTVKTKLLIPGILFLTISFCLIIQGVFLSNNICIVSRNGGVILIS